MHETTKTISLSKKLTKISHLSVVYSIAYYVYTNTDWSVANFITTYSWYLGVSINPFVYFWLNTELRRDVRKMFGMKPTQANPVTTQNTAPSGIWVRTVTEAMRSNKQITKETAEVMEL